MYVVILMIMTYSLIYPGDCCDHDRMLVGFTIIMQSVPITTDIVSSNLDQGEVYNIM